MSPLRYAIIGTGMMGQEHIRNIALLGDARVTAIADPDEGMRSRAAALAGPDCLTFADHRALLATAAADVLVIATPNHTHVDVLADALATDLPVLVEKPLCTNLADCRATLRRAAARRAPVWVAMEYRYMPPVARLIAEVRSGTVGRLCMLSIREHRYPFLEKVGNWNRFAANTGGTLVEKCCHFFDLMRLIVGAEPVRVFASGAQDVNHLDERYDGAVPDILDNAYVIVDFADGVRAMLDLCMFADGVWFQEQIAATGDAAAVEARLPGPARFWPPGASRAAEIVIAPRATPTPRREVLEIAPDLLAAGDHHGATYFQHVRFAEMVRTGGRPEVTLDDGYRAVALGIAAETSVREGRPVRLAECGL